MAVFLKTLIFSAICSLIACGGNKSFDQFDELESKNSYGIPSGSIIVTSNNNGTSGPGLLSVWKKNGELDRVIYDYAKSGLGYASGAAILTDGHILAVTDTGGNASNDSLDLFNYETPFANPISLFSTLYSGGSGTYMRQMAVARNSSMNQYYAFVAESGSNRVARLSSNIASSADDFNFTRDFNFAANGTCTVTAPYGVAVIPGTEHVVVVHSQASGRVNIFDFSGNCVGSAAMPDTPTGAAVHSSGKILVTYSGSHSILAHDPATGVANPVTPIYASATKIPTPRAIATDAHGNIYVGSDTLDQVIKLHWDGVSATATYEGVVVRTSIFNQNITSITVVP